MIKLKSLIKEYDEPLSEHYWLSPELKMIKVPPHNHVAYAKTLIYPKYPNIVNLTPEQINTVMYNMGYVKVTIMTSAFSEDRILTYSYNPKNKLEPNKIRELRDFGIEHNCKSLFDATFNRTVSSLNESFSAPGEIRWWMDTKGTFYDVSDIGHKEWAKRYITKKFGPEHDYTKVVSDPWRQDYAYDILWSMGWIRALLIKNIFYFQYEKDKKLNSNTLKYLKNKAREVGADGIYDENQRKVINESILPAGGEMELGDGYILKNKGGGIFKAYDEYDDLAMSISIHINDKKIPSVLNVNIFDGHRGKGLYRRALPILKQLFGNIRSDRFGSTSDNAAKAWKSLGARTLGNNDPDSKETENSHFMLELMSFKQLSNLTDDGRKDRSRNVRVKSLPISSENNQESWNFSYKSNPSTTGERFKGNIKFLKENIKSTDNAENLKCQCYCGCPDYKYRFAYNNLNAGAGDQESYKKIDGYVNRRPLAPYNTFPKGGLCKHLMCLQKFLQTKILTNPKKKSNLFEVMDNLTNNDFNIDYYE